jgi:hypothetical protein
MALRKSKDDKHSSLPPTGDGGPSSNGSSPEGESLEECVAVGQALVESGQLPADQLQGALADGKGDLWSFGQIVLTKYGVGRAEYAAALGRACGLPVADPKAVSVNKDMAEQVEERIARKYFFIPVADHDGKVMVWGSDVSQKKRDAAESAAGKKFEWYATDPKTVTSYMEQMWRSDADISRLVATFQEQDAMAQVGDDLANEVSLDDQAPVVQLVSRIVGQALRDRASDIHIEPLDRDVRVRYRIDGQLVEAVRLPMSAHNPLVSRLKIMSSMNIVEKRAPQDGQFSTTVDGRPLDVRVSSVATVFGEKVVMRLLDKSKSMVGPARARHAPRDVQHVLADRARALRHGDLRRPDRCRQDDHALRDAARDQLDRQERDHDRGSGRVRVPGHQPGGHERAGGAHVRHRPEGPPAAGPRRDPRR